MKSQLDRCTQTPAPVPPTTGCFDRHRSRRASTVPWVPLLVCALIVAALLLPWPLTSGLPQQAVGDRSDDSAKGQATTRPTDDSPFVTRDKHGRLQWPRPRTSARQVDRRRMVASQIARGGFSHDAIKDERVLAAMRAVPRHEFVPDARRRQAYADTPLPIGHAQTISQPYIVALMTELLKVKEGDKVLEIGTGSGYQAAVLNELTPYVYTIEIVEPLHRQVVDRFKRLGQRAIQTRLGDGYDGWKEHAPFDGIIVTCAAGHVPPPLWEQLKPGGRMVIPVGGVYDVQRLLVLTKQPDGTRKSRSVLPVRFVPMTGKMQDK